MKRFILSMGLIFNIFVNGLMAEQATDRGRQDVQDYRAKIQQENQKPLKNSKESSQELNTAPKKISPVEPVKVAEKRTETQSQAINDRMNRDAEDEAMANQLKKMPQEQRERSAQEYRTKRAEQQNKSRRNQSENKAASGQLNKKSPEHQK